MNRHLLYYLLLLVIANTSCQKRVEEDKLNKKLLTQLNQKSNEIDSLMVVINNISKELEPIKVYLDEELINLRHGIAVKKDQKSKFTIKIEHPELIVNDSSKPINLTVLMIRNRAILFEHDFNSYLDLNQYNLYDTVYEHDHHADRLIFEFHNTLLNQSNVINVPLIDIYY